MTRYKVIYDKRKCIGAAACVAVCSEYWEMKPNGKADLINAKLDENNMQTLEVDEKSCNKEAAEMCPVRAIKLVKLKN